MLVSYIRNIVNHFRPPLAAVTMNPSNASSSGDFFRGTYSGHSAVRFTSVAAALSSSSSRRYSSSDLTCAYDMLSLERHSAVSSVAATAWEYSVPISAARTSVGASHSSSSVGSGCAMLTATVLGTPWPPP